MIDRDLPVSEEELHAYVDGELAPDRKAAVEAWLANHPEDMTRVNAWHSLADAIRTRYGAVATEPVPARLSLRQIERAGRSWRGMAGAAARAPSRSPPSSSAVSPDGWRARSRRRRARRRR